MPPAEPDEPTPPAPLGDVHRARAGLTRRAKALIIAGGAIVVALIVAVAVVFGYVQPQQAHQSAADDFTTAVEAYNSGQSDLTTQIGVANELAAKVTTDDVADPATLDQLNAQLQQATSLVAAPPAIAQNTQEISQQTSDLAVATQSAATAVTALASAVQGVQQSRLAKSVALLQSEISDAQQTYDSSDWLGAKKDRTALKDQIDSATQAAADPSSLGSDPDSVVAALADANTSLTAAAKVVANEVKKATNATYTYLLLKTHLSCGWYICASSDGELVSVKVTVTGSTVTALLCLANGQINANTCISPGENVAYWWKFTGQRNGKTAIVSSSRDGNQFAWGTITFAGTAPNSAVTKFAGADRCQRQNGTFGKETDFGCK